MAKPRPLPPGAAEKNAAFREAWAERLARGVKPAITPSVLRGKHDHDTRCLGPASEAGARFCSVLHTIVYRAADGSFRS